MGRHNQQHHWLPTCYLKQFSLRREKPRIQLLDLGSGIWRRNQNPKKCFRARGFYAVDLEGVEENWIETELFGELEAYAGHILPRLHREATRFQRTGTSDLSLSIHDVDFLATFTAFTRVRTAQTRSLVVRSANARLETVAARMTSDEATFETVRMRLAKESPRANDEDVRAFLSDFAHHTRQVKFGRTELIKNMVESGKQLGESLRKRSPRFLIPGPTSGLFISSDSPVSTFDPSLEVGEVTYPLPADSDDFPIFFPLSPHLMLCYDDTLPTRFVGRMSPLQVALANAGCALPNARTVISATDEFRWARGSEILGPQELVAEWANVNPQIDGLSKSKAEREGDELFERLRADGFLERGDL